MSDLSSELRQVADAAAHQARPLPAADVIRRGDLRRRRSIAQRSLGGLSAIGAASLAGVMIFTGGPVASQAASGGATHPPGFTAVTDKAVSAAGTMTLHVNYQVQRHDMIKVLAVTCSGHSKVAIPGPFIVFEFEVNPKGKNSVEFFVAGRVKHTKNGGFSVTLPVRRLSTNAKKHKGLVVPDDSTLKVAFGHVAKPGTEKTSSAVSSAPLQIGMIFTAGSTP